MVARAFRNEGITDNDVGDGDGEVNGSHGAVVSLVVVMVHTCLVVRSIFPRVGPRVHC